MDVYNEDPNLSSSAEVQFAIGYAHLEGSGSIGNTTKLNSGNRDSAAMYRQFRNVIVSTKYRQNLLFTATTTVQVIKTFTFISFQRARQREKIDPGNWELKLWSGQMFDESYKTN